MILPVSSPYLVPFDGKQENDQFTTQPPDDTPDKKGCKKALAKEIDQLDELQRRLYAEDRRSLLIIFQAMDAAGKDSTIRAVMTGIDPSGCQVFSFKQPSKEELDHDFLWRSTRALPERGRIGIFNRSYYEETLVVRVHPDFLNTQRITIPTDLNQLWQHRFDSIRHYEKHLADNGTVVLKFWLNVSKDEQRRRFLSRLDEVSKNWKFSIKDVEERQHWDSYMHAYHQTLAASSQPWAPWYAIPADNKPYMRWQVARIVRKTLQNMDPQYPKVVKDEAKRFAEMRKQLGKL
ncbi:MAG: polyphosphate kinase 2 family protein [Candidatus Thiodiazotropha sp.]|nr:polyphosphate kinase 2 family protein [Candidatus Thiodiazotropha sp.]MCU7803518.1 polyphosphate kinase 2 family protein [Candidatus Thiodiazotropha sp. (ex Lucinoma borealis)]MCU7838515.1 polyphosphate kinase 2 family protein [Candidatus Thiodiazotropha sp. (ex Troendleina suluensis)]MCU7885870.1 polyphosphate kinase 2 family protein [Candidatus Thiodiazotropha sp. (ex Lucinoma annulata)]MCM8884432.1 polyphosphate kinase 2 family protein [Candidatus Thiodiazotropha sp.]